MKGHPEKLLSGINDLPWLMRRRLEIFYTHLPDDNDNLQKLRTETKLCTLLAEFDRRRGFMFPLQPLLVEEEAFEEMALRCGISKKDKIFSGVCRQLRQLCISYVRDRRHKIKDSYESLRRSCFLSAGSNILNRRISPRGLERFCQMRQNIPAKQTD